MGLRATLGLTVFLLVACRGGEEDIASAGRLSILVAASERPFWTDLTADFTRRTGTPVDIVEGPNSTDLRESMTTAALLAEDPTVDLVYLDVTWTPKFAGAGFLRPLDDEVPGEEIAALLPASVEAGRFKGRLYSLPVRADVGVLYYRRDWLEEAGISVPETFEELRAAARSLSAPPSKWGFVFQGSQYEGLVCVYLEVLRGFGGFWVDSRSGEVGLDSDAAERALRFLTEARGTISPPGITTYKEEESRRLFQDGRAVFLRNWPYVWRLAQAPDSPLAGRVGARTMVHAQGGEGSGTLGGWSLWVSRFTAHPKEAVAFARHVIRPESQRALCAQSGYAPARRDSYHDPRLLAANPFLADLGPLLDSAVARPPLPRYAQISDVLQRHLTAALTGGVTPREALRAAARQTRLILGSAR